MKYELMDMCSENAVIKVIGVGGGGGNAVDHMVDCNIDGVQFICANTDAQALRGLQVATKVQLGVDLTKGLGAGTKPEIGRQAAEENKDRIKEEIEGADMIFLTAGMGGGTGTGAITVIAEVAKEMGILTVAVVTKPFEFEGKKKKAVAEAGIKELEKHVDSLIIIPNQKLLPVLGNNLSLTNAFKAANDVLLDAVQGITELITHPGLINVDFADVKTVMSNMGTVGHSRGRHCLFCHYHCQRKSIGQTQLQAPIEVCKIHRIIYIGHRDPGPDDRALPGIQCHRSCSGYFSFHSRRRFENIHDHQPDRDLYLSYIYCPVVFAGPLVS